LESDGELIAQRGRRESDAFGVLVDRYGDALFKYAYVLTHNADDAQDLVQETFVTGWRRRRDVRIVDGSVLPWLLVTCRNHAANLDRKRRRHGDVPLDHVNAPDTAHSPLEQVLHREQADWIASALEALTPDVRRVVDACLIDGRAYRDVADEFGLEVATVAQRIHRVRARLRAQRDGREEGVPA